NRYRLQQPLHEPEPCKGKQHQSDDNGDDRPPCSLQRLARGNHRRWRGSELALSAAIRIGRCGSDRYEIDLAHERLFNLIATSSLRKTKKTAPHTHSAAHR